MSRFHGGGRRAVRRQEASKALARAVRVLRSQGRSPEDVERFAAKVAGCPCGCSGPCCGNRRRYDGPTVQELRAAQADE